MSVTYDYASGIDDYGATITLSHTCAGSDRYLLAFATIRGSGDKLSGVTYGGVAMTRLFRANVESTSLYVYGLAAPAAGTANIVYTQTSAGTLSAASVSATGVNQSATPYATGNVNGYMASPQSISVTSSAGDAGISYISGISADSADFVAESGQTEVFQSSSGELLSVGFKTDPTSVGWTWAGGLQKNGGHMAVVLAAASSGPVTHATTGALTAGAATMGGTSAHIATHVTSGALVAGAATLDGTAAREGAATTHVTSGALVAGAATMAGTSSHTASGSFVSDVLGNNTSSIWASTAVVWEWREGTGIGVAPTSVTYGTGTTSSLGVLTCTGLPTGDGELLIATTDYTGVAYQRGTVA